MRCLRFLAVPLLAVLGGFLVAGGPNAAHAAGCTARPSPALSMPAGVKALREGQPLRILAIGSSTTAGVGASSGDTNYPSQLARRLTAALGEGRVAMVNAGVSGETGPSTLARLKSLVQTQPAPQLVLWQVGTNDVIFGGDPTRLRATVADGLAAIAASGAAVVVIDQQYFPGINDLARYEAFVAAVNAAASARGVPLLRRYAMMKQWAAEDPKGFRGTLSWDSFHMNDAGYACLADALAPAIIAAAKQGGGSGTASAKPAR
ncbi:SGNH/GDSL hydrolase family protein [Xanthobacter aminoxidans]|uniref:SGNH/GDSL hydrolase family protein n=1 Tax=Xanthobacter aminoxidans TaxID=186280 RepID=A0ABW6ZCL4_9HYPH